MANMTNRTTLVLLLLVAVVALSAIPTAHAFGAGNIPSFAYMEGKAFRHGDIEDILSQLAKKSGGLLGSSKFGGLDIKRVYFGNWLRDYSQAMDVASLSKLSKQTIINIVTVLGFLAHGYATKEFQVTDERLGVYRPAQHLDNPKGYADGQDARQLDPRLRGPVDPRELEVDPRSGMKRYLADESGGWETGSGYIRDTLQRCIEIGRKARHSGNDADLYEAYRLLGQGLHTLEDFPAHSNWCELALYKLGHSHVFLHVGDNVRINAPDGSRIAPLVTGTFGSADFMHSMLGEAQDHLSEASISDLSRAVDNASSRSRGGGSNAVGDLLGLMGMVPGGGNENLSRDANQLQSGPPSNPAEMSPEEMYKNLWKILEFRDGVAKWIEHTIERIPGLSSLVEKITNSLNVFVFSLLEPYVQPLMKQAMGGLHQSSTAIINKEDQYEVFNDPNASDPTHSMLSKDHFGLILNETAGNVGMIIVRHVATLVVKAWDDEKRDARQVADECLAPMFHPYWYHHGSGVQRQMMEYMEQWARGNHAVIQRLDKEHVRGHTNTRNGKSQPHSHGSSNSGALPQASQQDVGYGKILAGKAQGYMASHMPKPAAQVQSFFTRDEEGGGGPGYGGGGGDMGQGPQHSNPDYGGGAGPGASGSYSGGSNDSEYPGAASHHGGGHHGHAQGGNFSMPNEQHYAPPQPEYGAPSFPSGGGPGMPQPPPGGWEQSGPPGWPGQGQPGYGQGPPQGQYDQGPPPQGQYGQGPPYGQFGQGRGYGGGQPPYGGGGY